MINGSVTTAVVVVPVVVVGVDDIPQPEEISSEVTIPGIGC